MDSFFTRLLTFSSYVYLSSYRWTNDSAVDLRAGLNAYKPRLTNSLAGNSSKAVCLLTDYEFFQFMRTGCFLSPHFYSGPSKCFAA